MNGRNVDNSKTAMKVELMEKLEAKGGKEPIGKDGHEPKSTDEGKDEI